MYSSRTSKLYNILTIDGDEKITPELLKLMQNYDGLIFTSPTFNQPLTNIPGNIKYIDINAAQSYKQPFTNLSSALIGFAFSANFPANNSLSDVSYLPHGLKIVYFQYKLLNWDMSVLMSILPSSIEYIVFHDKIYIVDMTHREVKKILPNNIHSLKSHIIFDIPFNYSYKYPIGY